MSGTSISKQARSANEADRQSRPRPAPVSLLGLRASGISREPSLRNAWRQVVLGWHRFFYAPLDIRVSAAVRMGFAVLMLVNLAVLYPDLALWFTDDGILPFAAGREATGPFGWSVFWVLPGSAAVVQACFWICTIQTVLLGIGFLSRLNAACVWVWLLSFQNRNPMILDSEDAVMRLVLLCLVLMPCGAAWSVDAWLRRRSVAKSYRPAVGLRLLQLQMCLIFFAAGLWKLGGQPWFDGTALYYVGRLDDFFGRFPTPAWIFDTPWVVALLTWSVIAAELAVPLLVWFRETRRTALLMALCFHLANEYSMHLFLFHWIMLVGWLSFVRAEDFAWLRRRS